jgi:hypothetical protein
MPADSWLPFCIHPRSLVPMLLLQTWPFCTSRMPCLLAVQTVWLLFVFRLQGCCLYTTAWLLFVLCPLVTALWFVVQFGAGLAAADLKTLRGLARNTLAYAARHIMPSE